VYKTVAYLCEYFNCCAEEDAYNTYASQLVRLYLAEGIACKHEVFVVADDPDEKLKVSLVIS
jgi:hypothetical protein